MRTQRAKQAGSEKKRTQKIVRRDRDAYYNKAIHGKRQHRRMTIFLPRENAIRLSCDILFGFSVRFGLPPPFSKTIRDWLAKTNNTENSSRADIIEFTDNFMVIWGLFNATI